MMADQSVTTGLAALCIDPTMLSGERLGLVTNFTGVTSDLRRNVDEMLRAGLQVNALFGPEHGLRGTAQAGKSESDEADAKTGLPLVDTYLASGARLDELIDRPDIDTVVFDLQDVGTRYWTYTWTMYDCMASAARVGKRFVVLDRPNPLGGYVAAGPGLDVAYASFVGRVDIPQRHGLTSGEIARLFNKRFLDDDAGCQVDLRVSRLQGWERADYFDRTALLWVAPSPNLPTLDSAIAFCGTGLFEGTNVSEGRGTTRPFEMIGAPYVDGRLLDVLRGLDFPGVLFREIWFAPTFHKYVGETLRGVQLHVTDRDRFDPVTCGVSMLWAFVQTYPDDFAFLESGERGDPAERGYAIDRLWGSDSLRRAVEAHRDPRDLVGPEANPADIYPDDVLLY